MNAPAERIQHELVQGTPEWDAFRLKHFGASEAAAMLGLSKNVKRSELLRMKHAGIAKEFSDWVQENILDHGHAVEELARPLAEGIIGEPLYPVTVSFGRLSASCDGLTIGDDVAFEHKQWNESLAASIRDRVLPEEHMPQAQQIMLVTGAGRVVFVCSDGTPENFVSMDVFPDQVWFTKLEAGWAQFEKDLVDYTPPAPDPVVIAAPVEGFGVLVLQVEGRVVACNLDAFKASAQAFLDRLPKPADLKTDQDFADAKAAVNAIAEARDRIKAAKSQGMAQMGDVDAVFRTADEIDGWLQNAHAALDKAVKTENDNRKMAFITDASHAFTKHVATLQAEISAVRFSPPVPDFAGAIKGLKTLASVQEKIGVALANGKIEADAMAKDIRDKLAWFRDAAAGYESLFAGTMNILAAKPMDDFQLAVTSRIEQQKKQEAETRERIRKEEAERLEREAQQQREREAAAAAQQRALDEAEDAAIVAPQAQVSVAGADMAANGFSRPVGIVTSSPPCKSFSKPTGGPPTLRLGQINERLAPIALTADGLASLGFPHAATDKSAKLYHEHDFPRICDALVRRIQAAQRGVTSQDEVAA